MFARIAGATCTAVGARTTSLAAKSYQAPLRPFHGAPMLKALGINNSTPTLPTSMNGDFRLLRDFASNVFCDRIASNYLPSSTLGSFKAAIKNKVPIPIEIADQVAHALKEWAMERGATHYTHWFHPMTGLTAEKHDSFIKLTGGPASGELLSSFRGKALVSGEPDASSFPSGGLRPTHAARGYTLWDPQTPPFINDVGGVPTLYIPTCFFSWQGHALDKKTPLLRSQVAVEKAVKHLFAVIGDKGHDDIWCDSGIEQEFFLIDKRDYEGRIDLRVAGRTLQGREAAKNQELNDHYFGSLPTKSLQAIADMERECWKLGIPITTRHQEVAPNQYEVAPIFTRSSIASDYNMIMMDVMQRVAQRYDLQVLFHEKPFSGINGSGKHNNWSIGSNKVPTFMEPGPDPYNNRIFMLTVAAVIRAVDTHGDLIRYSVADASNDHRLGGHEAPPSIISVYLGDYIGAVVDAFAEGKPAPNPPSTHVDLGVPYLPTVTRDTSDRNRTNPFAFTGNKFEVRCVGSSQHPAISNMILNTIAADSFEYIANDVQRGLDAGIKPETAWRDVVRKVLHKHRRVVFNGDGYTEEWEAEAKKRGLPNYKTTPDVLKAAYTPKNIELFSKFKVLDNDEWRARVVIAAARYCQNVKLEAQAIRMISDQYIVPAVVKYQNSLLSLGDHAPAERVKDISGLLHSAVSLSADLAKLSSKLDNISSEAVGNGKSDDLDDDVASAAFAKDQVLPKIKELRKKLDSLETITDRTLWPLASYQDILHRTHN